MRFFALVTAVNNNGTFGVSAIAGTGADAGTITLSAGGSAGNGLELYSDMVNGTFSGKDTMMLTGGADGTISNSINSWLMRTTSTCAQRQTRSLEQTGVGSLWVWPIKK